MVLLLNILPFLVHVDTLAYSCTQRAVLDMLLVYVDECLVVSLVLLENLQQ